VRGNAFQSSRTEPFGARFLRAALRCALEGDSAGVRQSYLDAVAALRGRTLAPEDVATVARITKTPEEYEQSRAKSREAAYEALLSAGRTRWRAGERVRFYRAADGAAIWLPDKSGNDTEDSPEQGAATTNNENRPPYDIAHYLAVLQTSFVSRFRKAFAPEDFEQLFRPSGQLGLFDRSLNEMEPLWIEAQPPPS
jgi:DNA polymerase I